jgi:hypothetical protein
MPLHPAKIFPAGCVPRYRAHTNLYGRGIEERSQPEVSDTPLQGDYQSIAGQLVLAAHTVTIGIILHFKTGIG